MYLIGKKRPARGGDVPQLNSRWLRVILTSTVGVSAFTHSPSAFAQSAAAPANAEVAVPASADDTSQEITVTGSRVVRNGYKSPTPVSVISTDEFVRSGTPNIADAINRLPALTNSITPTSSATSTVNGQQGINGLNLRGLGLARTLVLLDGQRVVPSIAGNAVDISQFPQQLVSRVDVVTGGASAAYGSDALSGVVNFVLDKAYTGIKGEVSGSVTDLGDDKTWKVALTGGTSFADGRGHFLISGEVVHEDGIPLNDRDWNKGGVSYMLNPAYTPTNGQPQQLLLREVGLSNATYGGMITGGPLRGTAFGPGGSPYNVVFGSVVADPNMSGGTWADSSVRNIAGPSLVPHQTRQNAFSYLSYKVTDELQVYGQVSWAHTTTLTNATPLSYLGNLTVKADNALLPATVAARASALGVTQFSFGTLNGDLGVIKGLVDRKTFRAVIGAQGSFLAFSKTWKWNAYGTKGVTRIKNTQINNLNVPNFMNAIDTVRGTNGQITCRVNADTNTINDDPSCVPYNIFGTGVNGPAAINYVTGKPSSFTTIKQLVFAANLSGEPFSTWAGSASVATGVERRHESIGGTADSSASNATPIYYFQIGVPPRGSYDITEGYLEAVIPLAKDNMLAKSFDLNSAVRYTNYSTFGRVVTWKVGATYAPVSGIHFRGTISRDFRAPTLQDLFTVQGPGGQSNIIDPFNGNRSSQARNPTAGNPDLKPEESISKGFGLVVQPAFLRGFSASADYFDINVKNGITSINVQRVVDLCFQGAQQMCNFIRRDAAGVIFEVAGTTLNQASEHAKGIDFEASYNLPLARIVSSWGGDISLRGFATYYMTERLTSGLPGDIPVDIAGVNHASSQTSRFAPTWRYTISATYDRDPVTATLTMRGLSSGVVNNNYIVCRSACPTSTTQRTTVTNNYIPGASYFDFNITYKRPFGLKDTEVFLNIQNVLNSDPVVFGAAPSAYFFPQTNPSLYDTLGRVFRAGVRFKM